ncbi:hypothetical protein EW146_g292 [Bondarzewia mesenterica]|uniref:Uncharacterized protein n=1 Tax=Bondarzewia mesenterica TaxID=1095465 RepID=A0A4V3XGF7_9AGAM|nr:hypothetical protein EW146_g292 [Bondarzewia mesenterica]
MFGHTSLLSRTSASILPPHPSRPRPPEAPQASTLFLIMSLWNSVPHSEPSEIAALKKQIANQDIKYSHLESELFKTKERFDETKATLNETHQKLRTEADRAVDLERRLEQCTGNYDKEKLFRQNAETALDAASEKVKAGEAAARELQATIETLSSRENGSTSAVSALQREKTKLEAHVRELEVNMQQVVYATSPGKSRINRPRSSEFSDVKMANLQRELKEARSASSRHESELQKAKDKLARAQSDLVKIENEKIVVERKMAKEVSRLEEQVSEKNDEIERLKSMQGDGELAGEREEELIRRVEEEEAKVAAMEKLMWSSGNVKDLETALHKAEKKLASEIAKVKTVEERNLELVSEKEEALDLLDETRIQVENLTRAVQERDARIEFLDTQERELRSQLVHARNEEYAKRPGSATFDEGLLADGDVSMFPAHSTPVPYSSEPLSAHIPSDPPDDITTAHVEKLLSAIERLRTERDGLRRNLEYLEAESKFAVQALESKLAAAPASGDLSEQEHLIEQLRVEVHALQERLSAASQSRPKPIHNPALELMATASLVMVSHLQSSLDSHDKDFEELEGTRAELDLLQLQLDDATTVNEDQQRIIVELDEALNQTQSRLQTCLQDLHNTEYKRDELVARLNIGQTHLTELKAEHGQTQKDLAETEEQLAEYARVFEAVESERDSLRCKSTTSSWIALQSQQLAAMSSGEVTRTLKVQIEELEGRVSRRTEQVGLHQHDIKRLEVNLRLQEDRVAEISQELETVITEKQSMVEDCAEAREMRDIALRRVENIEEELENLEAKLQVLETERETEATTLIGIWADAISQSRSEIYTLRSTLFETHTANTGLLDHIATQEETVTALWDDKEFALEVAEEEKALSDERARQATVAFAVSQLELQRTGRYVAAQRDEKTRLEDQLKLVQGELTSRMTEIGALQKQLEAVRSEHTQEYANAKAFHEAKTTNLELEFQHLQQVNGELESQQSRLQKELERSEAELRSLVGEGAERARAEEQLEQLRKDFSEQTKLLHARIAEATTDLQQAQAARAEADKAQKASLEELVQSKAELEEKLKASLERSEADKRLAGELDSIRTAHKDELQAIQDQLDRAVHDLEDVARAKDELEASLQRTVDEISQSKSELEQRLSEASAARTALENEVGQANSRHTREMVEVQERLKSVQDEAVDLRTRLEEEAASHARDRVVQERYKTLQSVEAELRQEISILRTKGEQANTLLLDLEKEKLALEQETTSLGAALQRQISLQNFLEKKAKDSEHDMSKLNADLEQLRANCARSEEAAKSAQMELTLRSTQHEHTLSTLRRQLEVLRSTPKQEEIIADLNEKIQIMDQLMRSKTQEIEENDDRFIELLKEKKKLTAKVESLNRKVQSLQNKLAAAKEATPKPKLPPQTPPAPPAALVHAPAPTPSRVSPPAPSAANVFTVSHARPGPSAPYSPSTPRFRSRMTPGPSALTRPKTPESRPPTPERPMSVLRAKTPEQRQKLAQPDFSGPMQTTSSIGKKRPAPEDPDEYASVQGFTAEGALDPTRGIDSSPPRMRKNLRTGFTPVRNTAARTMASFARGSPARMTDPAAISDVTNSPRSASRGELKAKRGWLGRIRGGSASAASSTQARILSSSRANIFERTSGGRAS